MVFYAHRRRKKRRRRRRKRRRTATSIFTQVLSSDIDQFEFSVASRPQRP